MSVAIYEDESGGTCIVIAAAGFDLATEAANAGKPFQIVSRASLPGSRVFRDAWKPGQGRVDVDLIKAQKIHMGRIRAERDKALTSLDLDYLRADERGAAAEKVAIAAEKQRLRDLPETFDLTGAETPEALNALWPEGLSREV
jgi:hypothetical protein